MIHIVPTAFIAILLGIGVFKLPYGYYTFLRIIVFIYSISYLYIFYKNEKHGVTVALTAIAILFNPILPIHLNKEIWSFINIATAIFYISVGIYFYNYCKKNEISEYDFINKFKDDK